MVKTVIMLLATSALIAVWFGYMHPIPQAITYHDFADKRSYFLVPNSLNVLSNIPFVFTGAYGLLTVKRSNAFPVIKLIYYWLFAGVVWTAFGSAYYHYSPDNNTLVWDRIPMTIVFMSLTAATIAEFIDVRSGALLLVPLIILGIASVWWWHYTESIGQGDLRLYALVQFYPMLFIAAVLCIYPPSSYNRGMRQLGFVVGWYIVAKVFEYFDARVLSLTQVLSGHTLKHVAAAASTWYLVKLFQVKHVQ